MTDTTTLSLDQIAEDWIADCTLSTEQIAWLQAAHDDHIENSCLGKPLIAPGNVCTEFDLPAGSTWLEVTASLLDAAEETGEQRLHEVQIAWGLGDDDDDAEDRGHD